MTTFALKENYIAGSPSLNVQLFFVAENPLDYEYYVVIVEKYYEDFPDQTSETETQFSTFKEANKFFEEMIE